MRLSTYDLEDIIILSKTINYISVMTFHNSITGIQYNIFMIRSYIVTIQFFLLCKFNMHPFLVIYNYI